MWRYVDTQREGQKNALWLTSFRQVPGGTNNNNYANVELIVDIAERMGVHAVWPGWYGPQNTTASDTDRIPGGTHQKTRNSPSRSPPRPTRSSSSALRALPCDR